MSEMMSLRQRPYEDKKASLNEALVLIETGDYIFIGSACGEPQYLVQGLVEKASHLADHEILHLHALGVATTPSPFIQTDSASTPSSLE